MARMARFGLVGVAATITHVSIALLALNILAMPALLSNVLGFVCAFLVSLTGQTMFTFGAKMSTKIALKFSAVALFAFSISSAVVLLGERFTSFSGNIVVSAAAFSVPAITYVCNSLWTFRRDPGQGDR